MTTPFDSQWWEDEADNLYHDLLPAILTALSLGIDGGTNTLPPGIQPLVSVDEFTKAAQEYARQYRFAQIKDITVTTRVLTQKTLSSWIQSGQPIDTLEQQISGIFGASRAAAIAATETTRAFAEGNAQAWQSTGFVSSVRFNTVEDDKVCPYCSPLDGQEFDVDDYGHKPPIHVNCRCFNTPVVDMDLVNQALDEALQ
jgi:SPP1 gp7 family putative phage head morphogenesis protein